MIYDSFHRSLLTVLRFSVCIKYTNILILRIFIANSILDQSTQRITFDSPGNLDFPLLG
jgi:hypothetical protein